MRLVWSRLFSACVIFFAICAFLVLIASFAYSQSPPKGIDWKYDLGSARAQATSRHIPIMIFVAEDDVGTQSMSGSLEDSKVTAILKHFACVFISRRQNEAAWRGVFVPWIVPDAKAKYSTPLLVFGDSKGKPRQEYRVEGGTLEPDELLKHLQKVLRALAPDEAIAAMAEEFKAMPLHEICKYLSDSVAFLDKNLSSETRDQFVEEATSAVEVCKFLKERLGELKDKEKQTQATALVKELQMRLRGLAKFTGKEKEKEKVKFHTYLMKARKAVDTLTSLIPVPEVKIQTETLVCKAIPLAQQVSTVYELEWALKQLDFVTEVSFEVTQETLTVGTTEFKIAVFTITCRKDKLKKDEIERVFREHYYEARWVTDK